MSTHCSIGIRNRDGSVEGIYVHSDGYVSYTGKCLRQYYYDEDSVRDLMNLGYLSTIGRLPKIGTYQEACVGQDDSIYSLCLRIGEYEERNSFLCDKDFLHEMEQEYTYLFDVSTGKWYMYARDDMWVPIHEPVKFD